MKHPPPPVTASPGTFMHAKELTWDTDCSPSSESTPTLNSHLVRLQELVLQPKSWGGVTHRTTILMKMAEFQLFKKVHSTSGTYDITWSGNTEFQLFPCNVTAN